MWQDPSDVESIGVAEPSGDLVSPSCPSLLQGDCGKPGPPGSSGRPGAEVRAWGLRVLPLDSPGFC